METILPSVFFSYSHADEALRDQLEKQLAMLKHQGIIETWHDRRIGAGETIDHAISAHMEKADIILLLVSHDFLASDYCYNREMTRAMQRHAAGEAIVIPVILRACDWHPAPFGALMATPTDGRPITQWPDRDQALLEVARAIRAAAARVPSAAPAVGPVVSVSTPQAERIANGPRSSNLRLTKQFTERDKDAFLADSFEFMAKFFENSLHEIGQRNPGIEGTFRRVDANRFTAVAYREGKAVARASIFMGSASFMKGIAYSSSETMGSNSFNENLSVAHDDQSLFLRSMGMAHYGSNRQQTQQLSQEGAAELYWGMFIEPLQRR